MLAVTKTRGITLLTGDGSLRKAAAAEGVEVMLIPPEGRGGTIGILDRLYDGNYIDEEEFHHCIGELMEHNGGKVRLPVAELKKRMK